jgi:CheY-like chemotaxis protein
MSARSTESKNRTKIAVVEETSDNIYSLRFILQSLGYQILSVSLYEPLKEQLEKFQPRVLLVDMLLPERSGFQVLDHLKGVQVENLTVVAITADAVGITVDELLDAGFDAVLEKPFSVTEMQKILNGE